MRRLSCHWLLSLLMALVLATAPSVAAGGHHGDVSYSERLAMQSLAMQNQSAWDSSETADMSDPDANASRRRPAAAAIAAYRQPERYGRPLSQR